MLKRFLKNAARRFGARYDYDTGYMEDLADLSPGGFVKLGLLTPFTQERFGLPAAPYYAAKFIAARTSGCGPCAMLVVRMAEEAGVSTDALAAIARPGPADADMRLAADYAAAVLADSFDLADLIEKARERFGEKGPLGPCLCRHRRSILPHFEARHRRGPELRNPANGIPGGGMSEFERGDGPMPDALRRRLVRLAYRYLGSVTDAEDVVQEAAIKLLASKGIEDREAWLARVVTNASLDRLRQLKARRETYVGPWLPEPVIEADESPTDRELDISFAVMRTLEALSPLERAAFFLHDLFGMDFDTVGDALGRSSTAVRKLASRARQAVKR